MDAKKKILVIDDDEDFLVVLEDGLRMDPKYDVLTVQDGYAALLAVQRELPDLVILDIRMPGPTGFEVCLSLRQDPRTSRIKILIPNPPKDTDGRREDSGRGWVRELQGRWPGVLG